MTIISPEKKYKTLNRWMSSLIFVAIISAILGVFLYNQIVGVRHDIDNNKVVLREIEVSNAELKNLLHEITNTETAKGVLIQNGLVPEKNPEYIKSSRQLVVNPATRNSDGVSNPVGILLSGNSVAE